MQMKQTHNEAILRGVVAQAPTWSHCVHATDFYTFLLIVPRLSGREDKINVILPSPIYHSATVAPGMLVEVVGEVRSSNNHSGVGSRLVITLLAKSVFPSELDYYNEVRLLGVLCKAPSLRCTPLGRDICDLLLAVNRKYRRTDYLPCIAWGSLALFCAQLQIGDSIFLDGRLQSRQYIKHMEDDQYQERTAFEISIMSLDIPSFP